MSLAFVFPGQGSQKVGMGKAWAAASPTAAATFAEADEALAESLSAVCFEGPADALQLTATTQPAILTTSVAMWRTLAERSVIRPSFVAGHSLGEYSALVSTGALRFVDAVRLVRQRGQLMQEAVPVGVGAMAAILGLDATVVEVVAREASTASETCAVANYNSPEQTVIAGHAPAVERAMALAKQAGAKRALPLPVSAPFHSPLMSPARTGLTPALEAVSFARAEVPVVTNVDARAESSGEALRTALVRQVDGAVRWVESVRFMVARGVTAFVEIGPGNVLSGLGKRIAPDANWLSLQDPGQIDQILAAVSETQG